MQGNAFGVAFLFNRSVESSGDDAGKPWEGMLLKGGRPRACVRARVCVRVCVRVRASVKRHKVRAASKGEGRDAVFARRVTATSFAVAAVRPWGIDPR